LVKKHAKKAKTGKVRWGKRRNGGRSGGTPTRIPLEEKSGDKIHMGGSISFVYKEAAISRYWGDKPGGGEKTGKGRHTSRLRRASW